MYLFIYYKIFIQDSQSDKSGLQCGPDGSTMILYEAGKQMP